MLENKKESKPVFLYTADLHLTSRRADDYRWDIFKYLAMVIRKRKVTDLFILGDLTDQKDRHSGELVSKITGSLASLVNLGVHIWIIKGNHDYTLPNLPFFKFLGALPRIHYFTFPETVTIKGKVFRMLPHDSSPVWRKLDFDKVDRVLMHQPIIGSVLANGWNLESGMSVNFFTDLKTTILSGDIHVPQTIGPVRYIGAPYPIHFGDVFEPRVLLEEDNKFISIKIPSIAKRIVVFTTRNKEEVLSTINTGDQVKLILKLKRSEFMNWRNHKDELVKAVAKQGGILQGIELQEIKELDVKADMNPLEAENFDKLPQQSEEFLFKRYVKEKGIARDVEKIGRDILDDIK